MFEGHEEVAFLMVGNNATNTQNSLDGVREKRHKFICLNDNMNHRFVYVHVCVYVFMFVFVHVCLD